MHIYYLHQYFATNEDSTGTRSYDLARLLVDRGHRVTLITGGVQRKTTSSPKSRLWAWRRRNVDGIDVYFLNLNYHQGLSGPQRVLRFVGYAGLASVIVLTSKAPDVIFASCTPPTVAVPALLARALKRIPFVYELRDIWPESLIGIGLSPESPGVPLLRAWNRLVFRLAERLVTVSPGFKDILTERYGVGNVAVIPLGADKQLFPHPDDPEREGRTLRGGGIGKADLLVVYAGAFGRVNNLGYLLDAMALLRDRSDIKLLLVGEGKEKAALRERARADGLTHVEFREPMPKAALARVLRTADVGVNCVADAEQNRISLPNKVFDYLFAGLPVLTTAPAGGGGVVQELLEREGCGAGADAGDPSKAAEILRGWADDRESHSGMRRRARRLAEREYDRASLVEQLESVLEEALATAGQGDCSLPSRV